MREVAVRWLVAGMLAGWAVAWLMMSSRVRVAEDKAFVKGWAGGLRYHDERNPEVM